MDTYHINGYVIEAPDRGTAERCASRIEALGFTKDYDPEHFVPGADYPAWIAEKEDQVPENLGYWDSDKDYPVSDWQYEVANGDTRLGYHEWLACQHEEEEE